MTDIQTAKNTLAGHTICLCKDGQCICSQKRGIAPIMGWIADGVDLSGYSVADTVVGKAAAMLFVKCGIKEVFAKTLSQSGKRFLQQRGIACTYDVLTERIVNRDGTDMCPMEKAVLSVDDVSQAYIVLQQTVEKLRNPS